jgi:hypothetical protein
MREETGLDRPSERHDPFVEIANIDIKVEECDQILKTMPISENRAHSARMNQRREDLQRLKRVDLLYVRFSILLY